MTAAERLATNPAITVAARIGMFLTPILVSISLFVLGNYLASQAEAMQEFGQRVSAVERASSEVGTRVTTVETRLSIGQEQRDKFEDQVLAQLAQLQQQNLETQKAIARLEAKLQ